MDAIAREAGVAVGTLYHHFGTKDALLEAVVLDSLKDIAEALRRLMDEPDPWAAVEELVRYLAERQRRDRAFSSLIRAQPDLQALTRANKRELGPLIQTLLDRAKAAGQLRPDVTAADIPLLLSGLADKDVSAAAYQRYVEIVLAGLRATTARSALDAAQRYC